MKLAVRFALVMAVVAVVPIALTGWMSTRVASRSMADSRASQQVQTTAGHAAFVSTWMSDQLGFLSSWRDVYKGKLLDMDPERRTGLLRQVYRSTRAVNVVVLVDSSGKRLVEPVFLTTATESRSSATETEAEALLLEVPEKLPSESQPVVLGVPRASTGQQGPTVPVWVHMEGDEQEGVWLLALLSLSEIESTLVGAAHAQRGLALLGREGAVVVGGTHPLIQGDLLASLTGIESSFRYTVEGAGEIRGETRPVGMVGWTVVVVEPASVILAPVKEIRRTLTWVAVVNLLLALFLANASSRALAGPLAKVRDAARRVGRGEFGQVVGEEPGGEIGELVRAFDEMSVRLRDQHDEIEAFQGELQQRVEARTAELREAQQALIQARERAAVSELGAGLAHELNNPLSSVLGLVQVLRQAEGESGKQSALLGRLEAEAARCREVVHAMLRLSASETGPGVSEDLDLAALLRDVCRLAAGAFAQEGLELSHAPAEERLWVCVEGTQVSSVLAAVLDALRLGLAAGSRLEVRAELLPKAVAVHFLPSPAVDRARLMEDEWRVAGFGLWVARELAHRSGAQLNAPSEGNSGWSIHFQRGADA